MLSRHCFKSSTQACTHACVRALARVSVCTCLVRVHLLHFSPPSPFFLLCFHSPSYLRPSTPDHLPAASRECDDHHTTLTRGQAQFQYRENTRKPQPQYSKDPITVKCWPCSVPGTYCFPPEMFFFVMQGQGGNMCSS